jgi:RNA polymerase sigma-70 factor (ECF subfamily)
VLTQSTHITLLARLGNPDDPPEYAQAWAEFQVRYGELIRRVALRRGLQAADCDDVMQDTMMALGKSMPGFSYDPQRGTFRSYLKTVVSHIVSKKLRQNHPRQTLYGGEGQSSDHSVTDDEANLESIWEAEWRRYHLQQAMRTIEAEFNEADRAAFTQYALEGHDATETASLLRMSIDQVYQAKSRIVKRLGELIEQQVADEG